MPTNAEIHTAIDLLIRQPNSHILTNAIADMLDDIVDNIQSGGGGVPTLDQVLAQGGQLTAERSIDLNGNSIQMLYDGLDVFRIDIAGLSQTAYLRSKSGTNRGEVNPASTEDNSLTTIWASFNNDAKKANIELVADATKATATYEADTHKFTDINNFADNAAALVGGLTEGVIYRTGDVVKIVHE